MFLRTAAELAAALSPEERAVLRGAQGLTADELDARSLLLLDWAGRLSAVVLCKTARTVAASPDGTDDLFSNPASPEGKDAL